MRHNSIKITQLVSGRGRQNPGQDQTPIPLLSLSSSERRGKVAAGGGPEGLQEMERRQHQGVGERGTCKGSTEVGLLV